LRQCNTRNTNLIGTQRSQGAIYENPFLDQVRSVRSAPRPGLFNVSAVKARPKGTQQGHPTCEE
jgi:hypothetical protein